MSEGSVLPYLQSEVAPEKKFRGVASAPKVLIVSGVKQFYRREPIALDEKS